MEKGVWIELVPLKTAVEERINWYKACADYDLEPGLEEQERKIRLEVWREVSNLVSSQKVFINSGFDLTNLGLTNGDSSDKMNHEVNG